MGQSNTKFILYLHCHLLLPQDSEHLLVTLTTTLLPLTGPLFRGVEATPYLATPMDLIGEQVNVPLKNKLRINVSLYV
jgi:hypothetical protein